MSKKKKIHGMGMPVFTRGKMIRLLVFAVFISAGFFLRSFFPGMNTFGWGFTLGLVGMAILTG